MLRAEVPTLEDDRYFHPDMEAAAHLVRRGALARRRVGCPGWRDWLDASSRSTGARRP